jgi:hypothetical protein
VTEKRHQRAAQPRKGRTDCESAERALTVFTLTAANDLGRLGVKERVLSSKLREVGVAWPPNGLLR